LSKNQAKARRSPNRFLLLLSMHWIRGALYIAAILVAWYFVKPIIPALMELTGNRNAAITFILFAVFGPLIVGWFAAKVVNPLLRNSRNIKGVAKWEDRIVRELAPDSERAFPVVLVPWPSETVKTMALLVDTYPSADGQGQLASVYLPGTPDPTKGNLRVVATDKLVYTGWALSDLLHYHFSFGATGPDLHADQEKA